MTSANEVIGQVGRSPRLPEPMGYVTLWWNAAQQEWIPVVPENAVRAIGCPIKLVRVVVADAQPPLAPEKVECPNCGQLTEESPDRPLFWDHLCQYPCQPAPPEPAATEVSDAVQRRILSEPDIVIGAVGGAAKPAPPVESRGVWRCECCAEIADPLDPRFRWNGECWQHHHAEAQTHFDCRFFGPPPEPAAPGEMPPKEFVREARRLIEGYQRQMDDLREALQQVEDEENIRNRAHAPPVAVGMTEELAAPYGDLCWLITCPIGPGHPLPVYYCGFSGLGTTGDYPLAEEDPNKAIRFCRLEDAQKIIVCSVSLTVGGWFASEHLFVSDRKGLQ